MQDGYDLTILVIITIMFVLALTELISKTQIHKLLPNLVYF